MNLQTNIKKFTQNTLWIIIQNIYTLFVGVFVLALVARYFGPKTFGEFNYASSIVALFTAFSTLGLQTLTVKSLLDKEYDEGTILCTSLLLRIFGGIFLCVISAITVRILQPSDKLLQAISVVLSIAMIFRASEAIDYWAQAYLKSKITSIARIISLTLTSLYKLYIVFSKGTLFQYAFATLLDAVVVGVFLFIAYFSIRTDRSEWKFKKNYAFDILKKCWYITISGLMITIYMRIDQVMLGSMIRDKTEVGLYAAAVNIAQMWYFVPSAIVVSFQSIIMGYHAKGDAEKYNYHMKGLYTVTTYVSLAFAIVISVFSPIIINIMYGSSFAKASSILIVSIWGGIFAIMGTARDVWLVSENLQQYTIIYSLAGCITNIIINIVLIPKYGAYGAAIATVITQFSNIIILILFKRTRKTIFMICSSLSPVYLFENMNKLIHLKEL